MTWFKEPYWQGWIRGRNACREELERQIYFDVLARLQARWRSLPEGESLVECGKIVDMIEGLMPPAPETPRPHRARRAVAEGGVMDDSEGPSLLGLTTIDRRFAEMAKGKGYARACRIAEAERALAAAAMNYARGPMSDTVGALRGLADAARALANAREDHA